MTEAHYSQGYIELLESILGDNQGKYDASAADQVNGIISSRLYSSTTELSVQSVEYSAYMSQSDEYYNKRDYFTFDGTINDDYSLKKARFDKSRSIHSLNELLEDLEDNNSHGVAPVIDINYSISEDMGAGSDENHSRLNRILIVPESYNILSVLSKDLLIKCLCYLGNCIDLYRTSLTCKMFSFICQFDDVWQYYFDNNVICYVKSVEISPKTNLILNETEQKSNDLDSNETWICSFCYLIQALKTSVTCEFCSNPRPIGLETTSNDQVFNLPYVIVGSPQELSIRWVQGRRESERLLNTRSGLPSQLNEFAENYNIPSITEYTAENTSKLGNQYHPTYHVLQTRFDDEIYDWMTWSYHIALPNFHNSTINNFQALQEKKYNHNGFRMLYFRCKLHTIDKVANEQWGLLGAGWEWTSRELRRILRQMWRLKGSCHSDLSNSTLRRALRKLVIHDWSLCYESLKREIELQAEGMCRDLLGEWKNLSSNAYSCLGERKNVFYEYTSRIISSCEVFVSWGEFVSDHCYDLNDCIINDQERKFYSHVCRAYDQIEDEEEARVDNSLSIGDICLLSLRNHVFLQSEFLRVFTESVSELESNIEDLGGDNSDSVQILLTLYSLLELLADVSDDGGSSAPHSKNSFHKLCLSRIQGIVSLAGHIRKQKEGMNVKLNDIRNSDDIGSLMVMFDENPSTASSGIFYRQSMMKRLTD